MIYNLTDPNRYLYHYTTARTAIDHILANRTLRLGPYSGTNDPQESKAWSFSIGGEHLDQYDMGEMSAWLSGELKAKTRVFCLSMDSEPLTGDHIKDIFQRGFCKPRMWAQYAERHTGFCLVFDWQKLISLFAKRFAPPATFGKVRWNT